MPCISSIATKITNGGTLALALKALGYAVTLEPGDVVRGALGGRSIAFYKAAGNGHYSATADTSNLPAISKKYAELGVREWAKRNNYSVEQNGDKISLVNRRG